MVQFNLPWEGPPFRRFKDPEDEAYITELVNRPGVASDFNELSDRIREGVEEYTFNLRKRMSIRNEVIRRLMKMYW